MRKLMLLALLVLSFNASAGGLEGLEAYSKPMSYGCTTLEDAKKLTGLIAGDYTVSMQKLIDSGKCTMVPEGLRGLVMFDGSEITTNPEYHKILFEVKALGLGFEVWMPAYTFDCCYLIGSDSDLRPDI